MQVTAQYTDFVKLYLSKESTDEENHATNSCVKYIFQYNQVI